MTVSITEPSTPTTNPKTRPKLRLLEHYLIPLENDRIQMRSATRAALLSGQIVKLVFPKLFPLLDGRFSEDEVIQEMAEHIPEQKVRSILRVLLDKGFISEEAGAPPEFAPDQAVLFDSLGRYFAQSEDRWDSIKTLRKSSLAIIGAGPIVEPLMTNLAHLGVGKQVLFDPTGQAVKQGDYQSKLSKKGGHLVLGEVFPDSVKEWESQLQEVSFAVLILDRPMVLCPWIESFNLAAVRLKCSWTSVSAVPQNGLHIGPSVTPGKTACWECTRLHFEESSRFLKGLTTFDQFIAQESQGTNRPFDPALAGWAASLVSMEIVRMMSPNTIAPTSGKFLTIDLESFDQQISRVVKVPRCSACGSVNRRPHERIWS